VMSNATARQYLDRFATHSFTDGVMVDTSTFGSFPDTHVKPWWDSEQGADRLSAYADAFSEARSNIKVLTNCGGSAIMWGGYFWDITTGAKDPRFYTTAQFMRFVRPGMKRIKSTSPDSRIAVGAYANAALGSMSVVLVNSSASPVSVTLRASSGSLPGQFDMRVTSATQNFVNAGSVSSAAVVSVPANGIVSLGYRYQGVVSTAVRAPTPASAIRQPSHYGAAARVCDLRGRLAASLTAPGAAAGVRCAVGASPDGAAGHAHLNLSSR
jgi:hypothetical protein